MKDLKYTEHKPVSIAQDELEDIEWEIEALNIARDMDIDLADTR